VKLYSVIVHYNTPEDVIRLASELVNCTIREHSVLVVDNLSEAPALELLQKELTKLPGVQVLPQQKNGGFGYGVNRAVEYIAEKEEEALVHVINSDAGILNRDYLTVLADFLSSNPAAAMVGPRVLEQDGKTVQNTILPITTVSGVFSFRKKYSAINQSAIANKPVQVDCLNGVCFMIRLSAYLKVGGFDEQYFMYNEEQDLCFKLNQSGQAIYFLPVDSIVHEGASLDAGEKTDWRFLYKRRNIVLFLKKHQGRLASIFIAFVFSVSSIPKFRKRNGSIRWIDFVKAIWSVA
jgi:GT2 family glycosyltransferase